MRNPVLRSASLLARPLMEWGHDWVVSAGVLQFRRRARGGEAGASAADSSDDEGSSDSHP